MNVKRTKDNANRRIRTWRNVFFIGFIFAGIMAIMFYSIYSLRKSDDHSKYTEKGCASYDVSLKEDYNPYGDGVPSSNMQYLSSKLNGLTADLYYKINMQKKNVEYKYTYVLKEVAEVVSVETGKTIIRYDNEIKRITVNSYKGDELLINENHYLDYSYHDEKVTKFLNEQSDLRTHKVSATLKLVMEIELKGVCQDFEADMSKFPAVYITVPLATDTVSISTGSNITRGEGEIYLCKNMSFDLPFLYMAISWTWSALELFAWWIFVNKLSLSHDDKYAKAVKKIQSNYGSYIQTISQPISINYEQVVELKKFTDLLDVSNIIKQPVLIERKDDLETVYVVPESVTRIYMFKLKKSDFIKNVEEEVSEEKLVIPAEIETLVYSEKFAKEEKRSKKSVKAKQASTQVEKELNENQQGENVETSQQTEQNINEESLSIQQEVEESQNVAEQEDMSDTFEIFEEVVSEMNKSGELVEPVQEEAPAVEQEMEQSQVVESVEKIAEPVETTQGADIEIEINSPVEDAKPAKEIVVEKQQDTPTKVEKTTEKKTPGRPKKVEEKTGEKKAPGRPKKVTIVETKKVTIVETEKKKPGRPKKVEETQKPTVKKSSKKIVDLNDFDISSKAKLSSANKVAEKSKSSAVNKSEPAKTTKTNGATAKAKSSTVSESRPSTIKIKQNSNAPTELNLSFGENTAGKVINVSIGTSDGDKSKK